MHLFFKLLALLGLSGTIGGSVVLHAQDLSDKNAAAAEKKQKAEVKDPKLMVPNISVTEKD